MDERLKDSESPDTVTASYILQGYTCVGPKTAYVDVLISMILLGADPSGGPKPILWCNAVIADLRIDYLEEPRDSIGIRTRGITILKLSPCREDDIWPE